MLAGEVVLGAQVVDARSGTGHVHVAGAARVLNGETVGLGEALRRSKIAEEHKGSTRRVRSCGGYLAGVVVFGEVAHGRDELRRAILDVRDAVGLRAAGNGPRRVHKDDKRGVDVVGTLVAGDRPRRVLEEDKRGVEL